MSSSALRPTRRTADLVVEPLADGVMVYDLRTDDIHSFDLAVGAFWLEADGKRTLEEIAARLDISPDLAEVYAADLVALDLLDFSVGGLSRRAFAKRAALVAAGIAGLSVISTISAPQPAAAASGPGGGGGGGGGPQPQCCKIVCGEFNEGSIFAENGVFYDLTDANMPAGLSCASPAADLCSHFPPAVNGGGGLPGNCALTEQFQVVPCGGSFDYTC